MAIGSEALRLPIDLQRIHCQAKAPIAQLPLAAATIAQGKETGRAGLEGRGSLRAIGAFRQAVQLPLAVGDSTIQLWESVLL